MSGVLAYAVVTSYNSGDHVTAEKTQMIRFSPTLTLVACAALWAATPSAVHAELITYTFKAAATTINSDFESVESSLSGAIGTGSFTYDPARIPEVDPATKDTNERVLHPTDGLEVTFNFLDQEFDEEDEIDFDKSGIDQFPQLHFDEIDNPVRLEFIVSESFGLNLTDIAHPRVREFSLTEQFNPANNLEPSDDGQYDFEISTFEVEVVPEPGSAAVILGLGAIFACRRFGRGHHAR